MPRRKTKRPIPFVEAFRFRLAYEGPLTSNPSEVTGQPFRSLDARCRACVVKGGDEPVCCDQLTIDENEALGFPCPRREFTGVDDPLCAELATLGAHGESGHLFTKTFDVATEQWSQRDRLRLLRRMWRAYADDVIKLALWPSRDAQE